ncbi:WecB/TagA/CpsF family glycosyltransferase [Candidatus Gottesmanbacteria bacterium]|nr:WecB/TagA/CpsF family glycosyltransferase [Candidatus Gottesmanbacteria bacterium]
MSLATKKILGINITLSSKGDILEEIQKYLEKSQKSKIKSQKQDVNPLVIFTPNPEIINFAQKDDKFRQIVNTGQINLPDGAGVVWATEKLYGLKIHQFTGVDCMGILVDLAARWSLRIGLIGGRDDLADDTLECLQKNHPNLSGWGIDGPEIKVQSSKFKVQNYDSDLKIKETVDKIIKEKTDILFVAMGFPKQEYFINQLNQQLTINNQQFPIILMAVGGAFDYISGRVSRAPQWMRNMGLEWLFRLIREPWRLSRQLRAAEFFLHVAFAYLFPIQ